MTAVGVKAPIRHVVPFPGPDIPLRPELTEVLANIESELEMPTWFLLQGDGHGDVNELSLSVYEVLRGHRDALPNDGPVALVVDSPGGSAYVAYAVARMLQRRTDGFVAVVPRTAKSAATLLCLGATKIIMGEDAELGPLDVQIADPEREELGSALNEVQALERLHAVAMEAVDSTMFMLTQRTRKKVDTLLPHTMNFVAQLMTPLLDKIDTVHFTGQARLLKVAEEYAVRLMRSRMSEAEATLIARHLVEKYPEHGFYIDADEAEEIDLPVVVCSPKLQACFDALLPFLHMPLIGSLEARDDTGNEAEEEADGQPQRGGDRDRPGQEAGAVAGADEPGRPVAGAAGHPAGGTDGGSGAVDG